MATDWEISEMVGAYVECALWAGLNWQGEGEEPTPLDDDYGPEDLSESAWKSIREDCTAFLATPEAQEAIREGWWTRDQMGHDFYLTRHGHGAGFWDRYYATGSSPMPIQRATVQGKSLTNLSKLAGSAELYVGDDGKLYVE